MNTTNDARMTREQLREQFAHIDAQTRKNINACVFNRRTLNTYQLLNDIRRNDAKCVSYYAQITHATYDDQTLIDYINASIATFR